MRPHANFDVAGVFSGNHLWCIVLPLLFGFQLYNQLINQRKAGHLPQKAREFKLSFQSIHDVSCYPCYPGCFNTFRLRCLMYVWLSRKRLITCSLKSRAQCQLIFVCPTAGTLPMLVVDVDVDQVVDEAVDKDVDEDDDEMGWDAINIRLSYCRHPSLQLLPPHILLPAQTFYSPVLLLILPRQHCRLSICKIQITILILRRGALSIALYSLLFVVCLSPW